MSEQIKAEATVEADWKRFIRKHWAPVTAFIVGAILAVAGAVYVFWWFTGNAQTVGIVPSALNAWSMSALVTFILHGIFWELLLVGIPVAAGAIIAYIWWKNVPAEEKKEHMFGKSSKGRNAGGAFPLLMFIAFAIKVYVDGNWSVAFSNTAVWNLDYVVGSMITILIWTAAIFAIPAIAGVIWWIHHENKP